jgi:hypothetical protein
MNRLVMSLFLLFASCMLFSETFINTNVTDSTSWTMDGSPYIVDGNINIAGTSYPVLTIEEGVIVRFTANSSIGLGSTFSSSQKGGMIVNGSSEYPVLFTAHSDNPEPGFWDHIRTNNHVLSGSAIFNHAIFEYGGSGGTGIMEVFAGDPVFTNCVFRHSSNYGIYHSSTVSHAAISSTSFEVNGGYPLYCNAEGVQLLGEGNAFFDNAIQRILVKSQNVTQACTWLNHGVPYEMENDLTVMNGEEPLIIQAGTQMLFRAGKSLNIGSNTSSSYYGCLSATGVSFSAADPLVGWKGIGFLNHCRTSLLDNCEITHVDNSNYGAVTIRSSYPITITGCNFNQIDNYAIYAYEGKTFQVSSCTFENCQKTIAVYFKDVHKLGIGNVYQNNTDNRVHCLGGILSDSAIWILQAVPILVLDDCDVRSGSPFPVLQIPYGSILEFAAGTKLTIGYASSTAYKGSLLATGVTFRGQENTPGYWTGLIFAKYGEQSLLSGCTIRDAGYNDAAAIQINVTNSTITGCSVFNNAAQGLNFSDDSLVIISGNSIFDCGSYPLSLAAGSLRILGAGNSFVGNAIDQIEVRTQTITSSATWRNPGVPYLLTGSISIYAGAFPHLKIMPGSTILLPHGAHFTVGYASSSSYRGSLEAEEVLFTRADPTATPQGLIFNTYCNLGASILTDCVFEYSERGIYNSAVYVASGADPVFNGCIFRNNPDVALVGATDARATVNDCQFINNGGYPIKISASSFDIVSGVGNSFSGNNPDRILLSGGLLTGDYTWDNPSIPVEVSSNITIRSNSDPILTINSGLTLLFDSGVGMIIGYTSSSSGGGIKADGATFSALNGEQNGWDGITFLRYTTDDSYLKNCVIEFGGSGDSSNIYLNNSDFPLIDGCIVRGAGTGIRLSGAYTSPLITRTHVVGNEIGIECLSSANPLIGGSMTDSNAIVGNSSYGILSTATNSIDASYNWWGHVDGPTLRLGDAISGNIIYLPYRETNIGDAPAHFDLLLPAHQHVIQTLTPVFDWEEAHDPSPGDSVLYTLQICLNPAFDVPLIQYSNLSSTVYHVPEGELADDSHYYWRVFATDTQEQSTLCNQVFEFYTAVPEAPQAFALIAPANDEVVLLTSPLLSWQASLDPDPGDTVSYRVYRDLTAAFDAADSLDTILTQAYPELCSPGSLYYWKVVAYDSSGLSRESAVRRFYVHPDAGPRAPVDIELSVDSGITTITWESVPGAESYKVYYSLDPVQAFEYLGETALPSFEHIGIYEKCFYHIKAVDY